MELAVKEAEKDEEHLFKVLGKPSTDQELPLNIPIEQLGRVYKVPFKLLKQRLGAYLRKHYEYSGSCFKYVGKDVTLDGYPHMKISTASFAVHVVVARYLFGLKELSKTISKKRKEPGN